MLKKTYRLFDLNSVLLYSIIVLGAWLRFYKLSFQSFWLDELFTVVDTRPGTSLSALWQQFTTDAHPIFYFFIEWLWLKMVGIGDTRVRIPSAVFGVAGIPAIYYCAKSIFNKQVGLIAAALLAINSFHIEYSQEARSYTLVFLLSTLSFTFLYQFVTRVKFKGAKLVGWGLVQLLILYTHYFGIFIFIVQAVMVLILCYDIIIRFDKRFIGQLLLVFGLPTVLFLPMYPTLVFLSEFLSEETQTTTSVILSYLLGFFGDNFVLNFIFLCSLLYSFHYLFLNNSASHDDKLRLTFVLLWLTLGIFLPYYKSYLQSARFHIRYFSAIYPSILLVFAFVVSQIQSNKWKTIFFAGTFIFLSLYHFFDREYYYKQTKSDWRSVGKFISENRTGNYAIRDISPEDDPLKLKYDDVFCYYANFYNSPEKAIKSKDFFSANLDGIWLINTYWMPSHEDFIPQLKKNGYKLKKESPTFFGCQCVLYAKK